MYPRSNVAQGRTITAARIASANDPRDRPFVRILSGPSAPGDAFAAVRYRNSWYRIDDADFQSKRVFTFLMMFFSLAETGVPSQAPVLTLPVN